MRLSLPALGFLCFFNTALAAGSPGQNLLPQAAFEPSSNLIRVSVGNKTLLEATQFRFDNHDLKILKGEGAASGALTLKVLWKSWKGELTVLPVKNGLRFYCAPPGAKKVMVTLNDLGDHFFGVMEKLYPNLQRSPDLRGVELNMKVNGNGGMESCANAWSAFFMSSRGYGSFFDTFAKGSYSLGVAGKTVLMHRTGKLDWYVFYGPTGDRIHEGYFSVIGAPKKVPLWAMGPTIWKDSWNGKGDILDAVQTFEALKIPATQLMVDRPYSDGANEWGEMNWSAKFMDPAVWIKDLREGHGLRVSTWVAPLTWGDPCVACWKTGYFYVDLSDPAGVRWYEGKIKKNQHDMGVSGHKMDRGEEKFSEEWEWKDGTSKEERANKYLFLNARVTDEMLSRSFGEDQFNFARGAYHRVQPYLSALWGGDVEATWEGMANNLANAVRCGFMGFPLWGSDVTGYKGGTPPDDLCARWLEWGAWSGFFEIKLDDSMPSSRPVSVQEAYRNACNRRMELLPYLYSLANTSAHTGVLMKPMAALYPDDPKTYAMWDQYFLGPTFLVAPVLGEATAREVYLQEGKGVDFYDTTREWEGGKTVHAAAPLSRLPVYVKNNSIYFSGSLYAGNMKKWEPDFEKLRKIEIHAFPGGAGEETSFAYVDALDGNKEKPISLAVGGDKAVSVNFGPLNLPGSVKIRLKSAPLSVVFNGVPLSKVDYDGAHETLEIPYEAGEKVSIRVMAR